MLILWLCVGASQNSLHTCALSRFSCVRLFATLRTTACQAPLFKGFPAKDTGVGCHLLFQGIFPTQGWNCHPSQSSLLFPNILGNSGVQLTLEQQRFKLHRSSFYMWIFFQWIQYLCFYFTYFKLLSLGKSLCLIRDQNMWNEKNKGLSPNSTASASSP